MVQVSKVKGHGARALVASGDVRLQDLVGNNGADAAADLGRLRQQDDVITARRDLLRVRRFWYPIFLDLHKFMIAISRIEVNHDGYGGIAPDAMVFGPRWNRQTSCLLFTSHCRSCHSSWSSWFFGQHLVYFVSSPHHSGRCRCLALQCQHLP